MVIAVDFDGTCVTHEYPKVGRDIGAQRVLKKLTDTGARLILYTMRSGRTLEGAVDWFKKNNIPLWAINKNPEQVSWSNSPKVFANFYIDDAAIGTPLIINREPWVRPYVDWDGIEKELLRRNAL